MKFTKKSIDLNQLTLLKSIYIITWSDIVLILAIIRSVSLLFGSAYVEIFEM